MSNKMMKGVAATAITASSLLSSVPVMATEEVKDESLQTQVDAALEKVKETEKTANTALQEKETVEKEEAQAQEEYNQAQKALQEQQLKNDQYLADQLQEKIDILEKNEAMAKEEEAKLNALEEEQKQCQSDLQKAQENQVQLEKELEELQAKLESVTPEELQKAQEAVVEAQKQVDALQKDYDALNKAYMDQKAIVDGLATSQAQAQEAYDQAVAAKNEAQNNVDLAKSRLDQAQKNLESYESGAVTTDAQKALEDAKNQLNTATEQLELAKGKEVQTKDDLQKAQTNTKGAKSKMDEVQALVEQKQALLDKKNKEYEDLVQDVKKYKATYDQDLQDYNKAEEAVSSKQTELNNVVSAIEAQDAKIKEQEAAIQAQQKTVDALKAEYENALKLTSKDFFTAINDTNALIVFKSATQNTHFGDPKDATSLQNMKIALKELKKLNQIRRAEGVQEVKVTSTLMAISQIQTNESNVIGNHSEIFDVGENLAWGYHPNTYSAYEGWYTYEKGIFNDLVSSTPELQDLRNQGYSDYQIGINLTKAQFRKVGHYLNTINPNYKYAGSSMNTSKHGTIVGNVYDYVKYDGDKVYTVEEFEALLDQYMSENNPDALKAQWQEAQNKLLNDQNALANMNQAMQNLKTQKAAAEKDLTQLQSVAQEAKQTKDASNQVYNQAKKQADDALVQIEADRSVIMDLQNQWKDINEKEYLPAVDAEKKAKKAYEDAVADRAQKEEAVTKAKEVVKQKEAKLQEIIDEFEKNKAAAKKEVSDATLALEKANQTYDASVRKEAKAKKVLDLANENVQSAQKKLDDCTAAKAAGLQSLTDAKSVLSIATRKLSDMEAGLQALADKKVDIAETEKKMESLNAQMDANEEAIEKSLSDLNMMGQIEILTNAAISNLKDHKEIWQSVVAGGDAVAKADGTNFKEEVELFKELRKVVTEKKAVLDEVKVRADKKRSVYAKAKKDYEDAKKVLATTQQTLKDYLDSLKPAQKEDVDTSVFTNRTAIMALSAISLAGFVVSFTKAKREDE